MCDLSGMRAQVSNQSFLSAGFGFGNFIFEKLIPNFGTEMHIYMLINQLSAYCF